jgi:hypothetical protein
MTSIRTSAVLVALHVGFRRPPLPRKAVRIGVRKALARLNAMKPARVTPASGLGWAA